MAEWRRIKVADIGNVVTGKTPKTNNCDYYGGKMPFLTPSDDMSVKYVRDTKKHLTEAGKMSVKNAVIPENSICVSCIGSDLGKVVITTEETVTNQQINSIIVNGSQFDINYIYYSMVELGKILNFHSKTSTAVPIVNKSSFSQYEISCPDLYIQRKIGDVLSKLDEKIEENIKINNNLEQQIKSLYTYYFGEVKNDWKEIPLSDIIFFQEGPGIRNWQYVGDGVRFINIRCINNGEIDISTANMISEEEANGKYAHFMLEPYDIVMSCSGTLGRYAIVQQKDLPLCLNTSVIRFRPKNNVFDYSYIYGYLTSNEFLNQQRMMANGSAQINFGPTHLKQIVICEPPIQLRKDFNNIVFPMIERMIANRAENNALVRTRDALLPKLMSGELDVSNIDL